MRDVSTVLKVKADGAAFSCSVWFAKCTTKRHQRAFFLAFGFIWRCYMMSDKLYDKLKFCATTAIPAVVTAWLTIGTIWNIPYAEPIGATITALNVCLGVCLGVSAKTYSGETRKEGDAK